MTFGFPFTFNALSSVSIPQTQLSSSVATPNVSSNVIIPPVQPHFLEHYVSNWLALNDSWNLPNGQVQFDTPRIFEIGVARKKLSLSNPLFLGSGGSGAVFSFDIDDSSEFTLNHHTDKVAIKVSWKASKYTVQNECNILQILQQKNVAHVEQCLAEVPYNEDRTMVILQPVVSESTSSIKNLDLNAQDHAIEQIIETMVGMLLSNIITVDVQPLISRTGEVIFIDFTEAKQLSFTPTASDLTGVVGFCNEMIALIPEMKRGDAAADLNRLLKDLKNQGIMLQRDIYDIVESIWLDV